MAATTSRTRAQSAWFSPGATSLHCVLSAGTAGQASAPPVCPWATQASDVICSPGPGGQSLSAKRLGIRRSTA
eukprot:6514430-Prymnesium_polylepis.1